MRVVGVLSCEKYADRREACRRTWAKSIEGVAVLFVCGGYDGEGDYAFDGDTLYLRCPDTYDHLTDKTQGFIRAALKLYPDASHLFKCDDDTYCCLDRLRAYDPQGWHYIGRAPSEGAGYGSGGAGYLLSRSACELIAEADDFPPRWDEDKAVGEFLGANGVFFIDEGKLGAWKRDARPSPWNEQISAHYLCPEEMLFTHSGIDYAGSESPAPDAERR